jgi:hypothetical protein
MLRTNPRAAWAGTSVVGVISGAVAGYTFAFWVFDLIEWILPGLSLGVGLGLYFYVLGRATPVMALFFAAAIAFASFAAVWAGWWWYDLLGDQYGNIAGEMVAGFSTFAAIIAVASAVSFKECRNASFCLALIGIGTFAGTLMHFLVALVGEILGMDVNDAVRWSLIFVFLEGSIAAVIGYGLFLAKPNDSRKEPV